MCVCVCVITFPYLSSDPHSHSTFPLPSCLCVSPSFLLPFQAAVTFVATNMSSINPPLPCFLPSFPELLRCPPGCLCALSSYFHLQFLAEHQSCNCHRSHSSQSQWNHTEVEERGVISITHGCSLSQQKVDRTSGKGSLFVHLSVPS